MNEIESPLHNHLQNEYIPRSSSSSTPSDNAHPQQSNEENNIEIIRSIASYLSLSEVESIGSLYSLVSPQSHHSSYHSSHHYRHHNRIRGTPRLNFLKSSIREDNDDSGLDLLGRSGDSDSTGKDDNSSSDSNIGIITENDETIHSGPGPITKGILSCEDDDDDDNLQTPGLVALSPIPLDDQDDDIIFYQNTNDQNNYYSQDENMENYKSFRSRRRNKQSPSTIKNYELKKVQEILQKKILSHPKSIRSYCLSSHKKAMEMRRKEIDSSLVGVLCPDCNNNVMYYKVNWDTTKKHRRRRGFYTCICQSQPQTQSSLSQDYNIRQQYNYHLQQSERPLHLLEILTAPIFQNIPLSIIFDLSIQCLQTSGLTVSASLSVTASSIKTIIHLLAQIIHKFWSILSHELNPFTWLDRVISIQRKAMGISSEAFVTGIQSVATLGSSDPRSGFNGTGGLLTRDGGLGSVMSASVRSGSVAVGRSGLSDWWRGGGSGIGRGNLIDEKMFRKLKKVDSAAKVIKYIEGDDEVLTHHARKRVQKMMHYRVPLRPFVATIEVPTPIGDRRKGHRVKDAKGFDNVDFQGGNAVTNNDIMKLPQEYEVASVISDAESVFSSDDSDSPFMCTPKSFPPTPSSRAHVMARGTKFAQDVVFLARDQLRVREGLDSDNAQTRAMAKALHDGRRLAVFNAADVGGGIHLSCGQHSASKVGNDLYCSARGMIPVLRNCFVYFEMTVSTPALLSMMLHHASLSIGLSTLEMPLNALVGTWKGSVGLCSTGQIVAGSNWHSPLEPKTYGSGSTVGCLVYLDDDSAFETWDGVMVTANVVFNVDGHVIVPTGLQVQGQTTNQTIKGSYYQSPTADNPNPPSLLKNDHLELNSVLPLYVPREEELFPTLTLHSTQTEVLCRFCASDILAASRHSIGAPSDVVVYAVDGSVLFDDLLYNGVQQKAEVDLTKGI